MLLYYCAYCTIIAYRPTTAKRTIRMINVRRRNRPVIKLKIQYSKNILSIKSQLHCIYRTTHLNVHGPRSDLKSHTTKKDMEWKQNNFIIANNISTENLST